MRAHFHQLCGRQKPEYAFFPPSPKQIINSGIGFDVEISNIFG
jgi:hypothetical protein